MIEKLKPCPFCGEPFEIVGADDGYGGWWYRHREGGGCIMSSQNDNAWVYESLEAVATDLNTRPIEDALRAQLAAAQARIEELVPQCDAAYAPYRAMVQEARAEVDKVSGEREAAQAREAQYREALESLRQTQHDECEDGWYSCPKVEGYYGTDGPHCTCGMDHHNAIIDAALKAGEE